MDSAIFLLCDFFEREHPHLSKNYNWKIPLINSFPQSGSFGYQANVDLKSHLHNQWHSASYEYKIELAQVIVRDWGGVRSNKLDTLKTYVDRIMTSNPETPLNGVASYSKIFSIVRPEQYAIYDARVAACLNAVQINNGLKNGIAFNYVPGRNNKVGNVATKSGFTQMPENSAKSLCLSGWTAMARKETYTKYNELLSKCLKQLPGMNRVELEMILFSKAEEECNLANNRRNQ